MKKYLIPVLAIIVIATAVFVWRSSAHRHELIRRQRRAHMDSLVHHNQLPVYSTASAYSLDTQSAASNPATVDSFDLMRAEQFKNIWAAKHLPMPDSIKPADFSEETFPVPKWSRVFDDGELDEYVVFSDDHNDHKFDTVASTQKYYECMFVNTTVMKMLLRHLTNPPDAEEFARCTSGYFFAHGVDWDPALDSMMAHSPTDGWKYGDVDFGAGCDDSMICKYRIQYAKRIVEMKDPKALQYVSLRNYELMKFGGSMAEAIKKD